MHPGVQDEDHRVSRGHVKMGHLEASSMERDFNVRPPFPKGDEIEIENGGTIIIHISEESREGEC